MLNRLASGLEMASSSAIAKIVDYLVPQTVAAKASAVTPVFLDASSSSNAQSEFQSGRIPAARFFDFNVIKDETSSLPNMLPTISKFQTACADWGIRSGDTLIIYDNVDMLSSSRAWFTFTVFGVPNVFVLSGGLPLWKHQGLPLEASQPMAVADAQIQTPLSFRKELVCSMEDMKRNLDSGQAQVVDARSWERFSGQQSESRPGLCCGHIPGSINVPWTSILDRPNGFAQFAKKEAIRQTFIDAGVELDSDRNIILTCGSGMTASVLIVGLQICQVPLSRLSLYDGSWSEWGDETLGLPIEKSVSCKM